MTARDDCAKVTHLGQGSVTGVANIDRALRTRFVHFNSLITDGYLHYISVLTKQPEIMLKNTHIKRNEGLLKTLAKDKMFLKKKK